MTREKAEALLGRIFHPNPIEMTADLILKVEKTPDVIKATFAYPHPLRFDSKIEPKIPGALEAALLVLGEDSDAVREFREARRSAYDAAVILNNLPHWCQPDPNDGLSYQMWLKLSYRFNAYTGDYSIHSDVGYWRGDTNPNALARGVLDFWEQSHEEDLLYRNEEDEEEDEGELALNKYDDRSDHYKLGL